MKKISVIISILSIFCFFSLSLYPNEQGKKTIFKECCSECLAAWSKSPASIGKEGAVCGSFMTASPVSKKCADYFSTNKTTVSKCYSEKEESIPTQ